MEEGNNRNDPQEVAYQEAMEAIAIARASLAGQAMSSWFPYTFSRKIFMAIFVIIGLSAFKNENYYLLISFIIASAFSPRCVGEVAFFVGRVIGTIERLFRSKR